MIYVHLCDGAVTGGVAGVENTRSAISVEQVKEWCAGTDTHVTIRPVIDLNDDLHTDAYRPTEVMREQAVLTNATCVYPRCTRPVATADLDHLEDWRRPPTPPAPTSRPLCRGHHRYKTHGGWTVVRTGPTSFTWTSRYGYTYDWDTRTPDIPADPDPAEHRRRGHSHAGGVAATATTPTGRLTHYGDGVLNPRARAILAAYVVVGVVQVTAQATGPTGWPGSPRCC